MLGRSAGRSDSTSSRNANDGPAVSVRDAVVTVNEGQTALNAGTFSDLDLTDLVSVTASLGAITLQTTGHTGEWTWEAAGVDDLAETVVVTARDGKGGVATATFRLAVENVAPTATARPDGGTPPAAPSVNGAAPRPAAAAN